MMKRFSIIALVPLLGLVTASTANAQGRAMAYDRPLQAAMVRFELTASSAARNHDLRRSINRMKVLSATDNKALAAIGAKAPAETGTMRDLAKSLKEKPQGQIIRVTVRFTNLPQRALAPVIVVNGVQAGFPFGATKQIGSATIEQTFVLVPAALARAREKKPGGKFELAVQMGDDTRTRRVLDAGIVAEQIEKTLK